MPWKKAFSLERGKKDIKSCGFFPRIRGTCWAVCLAPKLHPSHGIPALQLSPLCSSLDRAAVRVGHSAACGQYAEL